MPTVGVSQSKGYVFGRFRLRDAYLTFSFAFQRQLMYLVLANFGSENVHASAYSITLDLEFKARDFRKGRCYGFHRTSIAFGAMKPSNRWEATFYSLNSVLRLLAIKICQKIQRRTKAIRCKLRCRAGVYETCYNVLFATFFVFPLGYKLFSPICLSEQKRDQSALVLFFL